MRASRLVILLTLTAAFFVSCEDVVQVKLDKGSKLYVIDAFVNDLREPQLVRVLYNDDYFSTQDAPPVLGAKVSLADLTTGKIYGFSDEGAGNHVFRLNDPDTIARLGHQYELRVDIGGVVYTSLATQRRTAVIRAIDTNYVSGEGGFGGATEPYYQCSLVAKDTVDAQADYYWVKTFRNDTLLFSAGDIGFSFAIDGTNGQVTNAGVDTTNFTPPVTFLGFKQFRTGDKCGVQVHSLSRECYLFFVQAGQQVNNGGLFATTPENVRTNMVTPAGASLKAVGWFNIASVAEKTITIP